MYFISKKVNTKKYSFPFDFEPNGFPFGSKSKEKLCIQKSVASLFAYKRPLLGYKRPLLSSLFAYKRPLLAYKRPLLSSLFAYKRPLLAYKRALLALEKVPLCLDGSLGDVHPIPPPPPPHPPHRGGQQQPPVPPLEKLHDGLYVRLVGTGGGRGVLRTGGKMGKKLDFYK